MTDIFDQATEQEEMARELSIALARNRPPPLKPKGKCYNCGDALAASHLFCNVDCRDDWQARNPYK